MSMPIRSLMFTAATLVCTTPLLAQEGIETITEHDFRAKLNALAHDSTRGRETPSPELEKATEWVATQFRNAGVQPGGDAGGYLQRFQLRHFQLDSLTSLSASGRGSTSTWQLGRDVFHAFGDLRVELPAAPVVLLAGTPTDTASPFGDADLQGAAILHIVAPEQLSDRFLVPIHEHAQAQGAAVYIVVAEFPAQLWTRITSGSLPGHWEVVGTGPRDRNFQLPLLGMQLAATADMLRAAGENPETLLTPARQGVRRLDGFTFSVRPLFTMREHTVANVIGVIEGSHPSLRDEAVVFTGHMDHVGVIPGRCGRSRALPADSICNGADDNASGTVGVIELAEAFAAIEQPPARTLIFAAVTAEERGLCGSRFYVEHPVVPIDRTVAAINMDMIARNPPDTVGFVGKGYSSLGAVVDRLLETHPELNLTPTEHQGSYHASDHFPFAQRGVPALFFFSGEHDDLHTAADNPERADAEQAARIVRLAFLTAFEVANATERPTWDPDARAEIVIPIP